MAGKPRDYYDIFYDILNFLEGKENGDNKTHIADELGLNNTSVTKYLGAMLDEDFVTENVKKSGYAIRYLITEKGYQRKNGLSDVISSLNLI